MDAANLGLKIYDADKPCHLGHTPRRYTSTGTCVACATAHSATRQRAIANRALGWVEVTARVPADYADLMRSCAERFRTGSLQERSYLEYLIGKALAPREPIDAAPAPVAPPELANLVPAAFRGQQ